MFRAATLDEVARLRASIARIGGLSDNILGIGRFGLGLDGILAWIPGVGALYSLGAGAFLLVQGVRARAPMSVLVTGLCLMGARSIVTTIGETVLPLLPVELAVDFFRAHKWTADLLIRAIDQTRYVERPAHPEQAAGAGWRPEGSGAGNGRVVFLG